MYIAGLISTNCVVKKAVADIHCWIVVRPCSGTLNFLTYVNLVVVIVSNDEQWLRVKADLEYFVQPPGNSCRSLNVFVPLEIYIADMPSLNYWVCWELYQVLATLHCVFEKHCVLRPLLQEETLKWASTVECLSKRKV